MSSSAFQSVLARLAETKRLDSAIAGNGYLSAETPHDVVIQVVDTSKLDEDRIRITFRGEGEKEHNETLFLLNQEKNGFGAVIRKLWSSVFTDKDSIIAFLQWVNADQKTAFEALTGMKVRITLGYGKGYVIKAIGNGKFAAFDSKTGDKLADEADTIATAKEFAEAVGLRRAFLNVQKIESTESESNCAALKAMLEKRQAAPAGIGKMV